MKNRQGRSRSSAAALAAFAFAVAVPGGLQAGGTHTLSVGATILSKNVCKFTNAGPTALNFGAIDPSSQANKLASASTTFICHGSDAVATYAIGTDSGLYGTGPDAPRMRHGTVLTEFLAYTLNFPQTGSAPRNVTQTLTINGTVPVSAFQNAQVGAYSDAVVLTIAP